MMHERRRALQTRKVDHYDGQSIYSHDELIYELGGYLGGGAAGVYVAWIGRHCVSWSMLMSVSVCSVYEAFCMSTKQVKWLAMDSCI